MNRDEFISSNPLVAVLEQRGVRVIGAGPQRTAKCPLHEDRTASMSVNAVSGLWHCHAGCGGGSVIDLLAKLDGISVGDVLRRNSVNNGNGHAKPAKSEPEEDLKFETVCTYDYNNAVGKLAYQVVRKHAASKAKKGGYVKTFRQRHPDDQGGWIDNMDGVERVLYRLPEVLLAKSVWVVEGEKDADTLVSLGFCATCNVGGAGKWMDGYAEALAKKNVAICGDNDEPGEKHVQSIFDSLAGKAKTVRMIRLPKEFKDVSEYAASFPDKTESKHAIYSLLDMAPPFVKGVSLPIFKLSELAGIYQRHVANLSRTSFELSKWLPGLSPIRCLVPGELVLLLAGTGVGKTAGLSNIAMAARPLPTLFFELELPPELMYERLIALRTGMGCSEIESSYRTGEMFDEAITDNWVSHLHICTQSRLSAADIESLIIKSELKIGHRPRLVLIDYIGLIQGHGKSRYEKVSQIAEDLKVIAKMTQTIIVVASQVNRDAVSETPEITLNSGKDSGSLENSSGLVIGMWRARDGTMNIKVLKSTKGGAGTHVLCDYNLKSLKISQRSGIDDRDVPRAYLD